MRSSRLPRPSEGSIAHVSTSLGKTSNPRSKDNLSVFGDGSCGEPFYSQHLLIDFTPNDKIDNEIVQRKVCSFWKFINESPQIKNLMVTPERDAVTVMSSSSDYSPCEASKTLSDSVSIIDGTAVSKLEFFEEKGLIDRIFEAKIHQSMCTLGSREYKETDPLSKQQKKKKKVCKCTNICMTCSGHAQQELTPIKKMCKRMKVWDAKHPKSMEQPPHAPSLSHAILQRQKLCKVSCDDKTSDPKSTKTISIAGDRFCGEPLVAQHLTLDFTPNDEEDGDAVQMKICSFWDFIASTPEIQNLKVKPEKKVSTEESSTTMTESSPSETNTGDVEQEKTAVEMMQFAVSKGMINGTLLNTLPGSHCTLGSREYKDAVTKQQIKNKHKNICTCASVTSTCCTYPKHGKMLAKPLKEWDSNHPKNMNPPGHAPHLQHSIMQRSRNHPF